MTKKSNSWVEIKLDNLAYNFQQVRKKVGRDVKILATVKADGYGHGSIRVAEVFRREGADFFGVATVGEGVDLRKAGFTEPVLLLGSFLHDEISALLEYDITPNIVDMSLALSLNEAAEKENIRKRIHINIDTGMSRTGVPYPEALDFILSVHEMDYIEIEGLFTHFPASDEKDKAFSYKQIDLLKSMIKALEETEFNTPSLIHIANSGAIIDMPESFFNMVRPGIMLYGYYPGQDVSRSIPLKPALCVKSKITFVKNVRPGTPMGYGGTYVADREQKIATVPIGYADGYFRAFSNKTFMIVNGRMCPVRGRISMDQTLVDVTEAGKVEIGTEATVYSYNREHANSIENLSLLVDTIPYELICSIGKRLPRYYC